MDDIAIHAHNISKEFRIGKVLSTYSTLRESLMESAMAPMRWATRMLTSQARAHDDANESIWALKDVSFQVKRGEVVGLIGGNGAGKSTLLKILSQITEPSEGFADIYGRVASLLEVGTGFHPELTGRENVYLNGAILGMNKAEIDRKFCEIVNFAGVDKFIDTPVKHYSSGMTVRLAFAVAAHLEPEILIIDEVLAVGDAVFQKKCLGRMEGVAEEGRTVLFVSHNMLAVQNLCHRVIWLDEGRIVGDGKPAEVVTNYLRSAATSMTEHVWNAPDLAPGNHKVRLHHLRVRGVDEERPEHITTDHPCMIDVAYWNQNADAVLHITLHVYTEQGILAFTTGSAEATFADDGTDGTLEIGLYRSTCCIPAKLLNSGVHRIALLVVENGARVIYRYEEALSFEVFEMGKGRLGWQGREPGVVRPHIDWVTERVEPSNAAQVM